MPNEVIIYALVSATDRVGYVGKTTCLKDRLSAHRSLNPWAVGYRILEITTEAAWKERERYWIAFYREHSGGLRNIRDGGQGQPAGYRWSNQARRRLSISHSGKVLSAEHRRRIIAAHARPEVRMKNRMAHLGKPVSKVTRERLRRAGLKRKAKFGAHHTPEAIEKMRQARIKNPIRAWLGKKLPQTMRDNIKKSWVKRRQKQKEKL